MTENQTSLINNVTNYLLNSVITESEKIKLGRTHCVSTCYQHTDLLNKIYEFVKTNDLERHLLTSSLNRLLYWIEFILEIVYIKIKSLDISIKERYSYWTNWKIQNNFKLLENGK